MKTLTVKQQEQIKNHIQSKLNDRGAHSFDLPFPVSYTQLREMGMDAVYFEHGSHKEKGHAILQIESIDPIAHACYRRF